MDSKGLVPSGDMDGRDWENLWTEGVAPGSYFDKESASPALIAETQKEWMPNGTGLALVPGCGRGYDVELLARSGRFEKVIGLDISDTAVRIAREYLLSRDLDQSKYEMQCDDFFNAKFPGQFSLIYDYTFLCALPLAMRPMWANRMRELIHPGGSLVTLIFPLGKSLEEAGPPHGVSFEMFTELLGGNGFKAVDGPRMLPKELCHFGREGRSGFARWLRVED